MSIQTTAGSTYSLAERAIYRPAVEAAIWGMPAVNYELMFQEMEIPPADDGVLNGSVMNYWQAAIEDPARNCSTNHGGLKT
jgi:hypothetical protein